MAIVSTVGGLRANSPGFCQNFGNILEKVEDMTRLDYSDYQLTLVLEDYLIPSSSIGDEGTRITPSAAPFRRGFHKDKMCV